MKETKGHLRQKIIEFQKFNLKTLQNDRELMTKFMGYMTRIMNGVKYAKKTIKISRNMNPTPPTLINNAFWMKVQKYAKSLGIDLIGFTEVDEYYIFKEEVIGYHVKNEVLDNAILLGMEMKKEAIQQAPEIAAGSEAMRVYAELGEATNKLAEYLHKQGVRAQAFHPFGGPVLYPPLAEKAGLGEIGVNGILITREFGPSLRLSMIATDAHPLPSPPPASLGIKSFCKSCGSCIKSCPGNAILPLDQKPYSLNGKYLTNIDSTKCFPHFFDTYGCSICIKVCPFFKKGYDNLKIPILKSS
ncbi:MAG: 4Fe-4S dicluster domain-containing protein [Candidatus Helarchaeota archaeon]